MQASEQILPLWKVSPNSTDINRVVNDKIRDDIELFNNLPMCHMHPDTHAFNYCDKTCQGPDKQYFCNDQCLDDAVHNHFPRKIPNYVLEIKIKW